MRVQMLTHKYTVQAGIGVFSHDGTSLPPPLEVGGRERETEGKREGSWKQYVYFHTRLQTIYTSIQYPRKVSTGLKFEDEGKVANTQPRYNVLHPRCNLYQENKREITRLVNHGTTDARPSYLLANANTQIYCTDSCTPLQIVKLTVLALVGNSLVQYYFTPEFYSI